MHKLLKEFTAILPNEFKEYLLAGGSTLTIKAPCESIGFVTAAVTETEIILKTRNFHIHIDSSTVKRESEDSISSCAVKILKMIISGTYFFHETYLEGNLKSSGAGPSRIDQSEKNLLVKMFGCNLEIKEFTWDSEL